MFKDQHHDTSKSGSSEKHVAIGDFDILDDEYPEHPELPFQPAVPWRVLVVDDDEEVHEATRFALKNVTILDKPVELLHAYTAEDGYRLICVEEDIAVALLDVVMESEDAGLKLVEKIRGSGFLELRIVLRTGQPGYAPELSVLRDYDINDYRTKAELTRSRLISVLTTSFRSYRQLRIINEARRGLGLIVKSSSDIFKRKNLELFSQGVLTQLISLLDARSDGVACLFANEYNTGRARDEFKVVTATGRFRSFISRSLDEIDDKEIKHVFFEAQSAELGIYINKSLGLYFSSREGKKLFVYVDSCSEFSEETVALLKVFAGNIAVGFENLALIERLDQLAYRDSMLDIPNRNALQVEFDKLKLTQPHLSLAMVHVNALSHSISVFGLPLVNKALLELRHRLATQLKPPPLFIAYDGKADLILLLDSRTADINGINALFDHRIQVENIELPLTATVAVVNVNPDMDAQTALRYCISALTIAKNTPGTNVMYYDHSMSQGLTERILLQSALRHALENKVGIQAFFQPKVRCNDGNIIGVEALCRWHLDGRWIETTDFIPIAEASGLSSKLTDVMLDAIGDFARQRRKAGLPELRVALNLSMRDLQTPQFARLLQRKLKALELSPATIEFELTESAMMDDPSYTIKELGKLKDFGYLIAVDDFGTGYSSLNYLERLPVNCLKIDKTFIDTLTVDSAKRSLAATTISIAERMGLFVVAEGIETKQQHDALLFLGCDACQGFYYGKPVPADQFDELYGLGPLPRRRET